MNSYRIMTLILATVLTVLTCDVVAAEHRIDTLINSGWKFTRENPAGAQFPDFDDAYWEVCTIPHTWNGRDGQDGGGDYYRGTGWYRTQLNLEPRWKGKSIFLKFDGASIAAEVFVNGRSAGSHKGSFGAFCFDVTSLVGYDAPNIIAVRVNNAKDTTVAPLRGDFTIFGGLYRDVHLLVLETCSISPTDYASPGIYVTQSRVGRDAADLQVVSVLRNGSSRQREVNVRVTLTDAAGVIVTQTGGAVRIEAGAGHDDIRSLSLRSPHLWNGRKDPYLYRVTVELIEGSEVLDAVSQDVGLRYFSVDPDRGFFLNGEHLQLHGVNRHQDRQNKGWAIGGEEHREDYRLIEEIGATAVRLAHYQQAQEFYDLCDRGGMIVWAELGLVDEINASAEFETLCVKQLTELIKQSYNHPSILFWSVFNELMPEANRPLYERVVRTLQATAKQLDPSRYTVMASRSRYDPSEPINTMTDIVGYNVYRGWYEGKPEDFAVFIDSIHARYPSTSFCISEYGAGGSPFQHEYPPSRPPTKGPWHPEEWQSHVHEVTWNAMNERPYLWGTFVWNMFDFGSDGRSEGDCPGRNDKGLVTYDRKIRKDAFYWYKAQWNPEAMVHITGKRYSPRPAGGTDVIVYANCDSVALTMNGLAMGTRVPEHNRVEWKGVDLVDGNNRAEVIGYARGRKIEDAVLWKATASTAVDLRKGK